MLYVSRGVSKLRKKSLLNELYGEDNASTSRCASTHPYKDCIYWFIKTCAIFDLPYRPHNPDIEMAYS